MNTIALIPYRSFALAGALFATAIVPSFAGPDCSCRFKGKDIPEGQIACLDLPSGQVLAQCTSVLNNTSWKTIQKGCPYSFNQASNFSRNTG